jgi:hypothetical protein
MGAQQRLTESSGVSPVLLVPDPLRAAPGPFRLFTTGSALLRFAGGLNGFRSIQPERLGGQHADLVSAFFGVLRDWIASADHNSIQAELGLSRTLDKHIKELAMSGFVVGARERFLFLAGGIDAKPESWRIVDIKIQPAALVRIVDAVGNVCGPAMAADDQRRAGP